MIYVVRRRTTTTTFLNFHFIIRSGTCRQGNQSASYKLGCARLKNQVSFFSFFLTSFIKVLFSSSSEAARPPFYFFDFFFSGQGLLAQKQSRVVEVDRCMYRTTGKVP